MKLKFLIVLISCTIFFASSRKLYAVSSNVPPESGLYEKLELIQAFGLVDNFISGMKPISREEFARELKEAIKNREAKTDFNNDYIDGIISELKEEFALELDYENKKPKIRMFDSASLELVEFEETPTPHLETSAVNRALSSNRGGDDPNDGFNSLLKLNGWIDFPKYLSVYLEPRMVFRQNGDHFDLDFSRGNLKFGFKNFELEAGRDALIWGHGFSGNMEISNNIEGLTMVKISNPFPAYLPWIFKYLGRFKFSMFFSLLEKERDHPYPALWGMAIMFKTSKYFEWGVSRITMLGGEGLEDMSFWEYFTEAVTGIRIYDSSVRNFGNGTMAFYFLFNFPFLRNSQLYFNGYFEDFGFGNLSNGRLFTRDLAFLTGINIPRLNSSGTLSVKSEFVKTTEITYRSGVYSDGFTYNKNIIGHHIGPDALGSYSRFTWKPAIGTKINFDFNYERHGRLGKDQNSNPLPPEIFEKPEDRFALIFGFDKRISKKFDIISSLGYERIENYNFKSGDGKNNALASCSLRYKF